MKYLIFGNGYIGNKFLEELGEKAIITSADIGNLEEVTAAVRKHTPDVIINAAGKTGKPNVDWCEDHKVETYYANVVGPLVLNKVAMEEGIRLVHIGSGCIYQGGAEKEYTEDDLPDWNLIPSYYSKTKAWSEAMLSDFPVLQVRLRMPIDYNPHPRNLLYKITNYEKVISVPNSISIISDFVAATIALIEMGKTGIYNIVNPGPITHGEILDLYTEYVDPDFTYETFSLEDLSQITKAGRSNCVLSAEKLLAAGVTMKPIRERLPELLVEYKERLDKS